MVNGAQRTKYVVKNYSRNYRRAKSYRKRFFKRVGRALIAQTTRKKNATAEYERRNEKCRRAFNIAALAREQYRRENKPQSDFQNCR